MRPSEIIAHALSSGELTPEDVTPVAEPAEELPPVPAATPQDAAAVSPPAAPGVEGSALTGIVNADEAQDGEEGEGGDSDSDRDSDYEPDEAAHKNDEDEDVSIDQLCVAPSHGF